MTIVITVWLFVVGKLLVDILSKIEVIVVFVVIDKIVAEARYPQIL